MKCPDCQHDLKPVDCKGVLVHECTHCKGKWFERTELKKLIDKDDDTLRWLDFDPFGKDAEQLSVASDGRICPYCLHKMQSLKYMDSLVVIDKCPQCQGVWLDPGELTKIVNYLENKVDSESSKSLLKDTFKQFIQIFQDKKGIIPEIKDFLAVLYLLELRIGVEHPALAKSSQAIFKDVPLR